MCDSRLNSSSCDIVHVAQGPITPDANFKLVVLIFCMMSSNMQAHSAPWHAESPARITAAQRITAQQQQVVALHRRCELYERYIAQLSQSAALLAPQTAATTAAAADNDVQCSSRSDRQSVTQCVAVAAIVKAQRSARLQQLLQRVFTAWAECAQRQVHVRALQQVTTPKRLSYAALLQSGTAAADAVRTASLMRSSVH
jgi:hypothetical protein